MSQVIDFVVHGHASDDAVRAARAILSGHGFSVAGTPAGLVVATRGNRALTAAFGALVPADRHYQRLSLETVRPAPGNRSPGTVVLRLRAHRGGAAVAAGAVQHSRTSAVFREVADRIATTLTAGGQLVARRDRP